MLLFSCHAAGTELYYIGRVTPAEYAVLPPYFQKFANHLSPDLTHGTDLSAQESAVTRCLSGLHHYCRIPVLRSRNFSKSDANRKAFLLTEIIGEANYVIERSQADAPLLPPALLERARARNDKRQRSEAAKDYLQTISLAPKTATPYLKLSRLFSDLADNTKALEYVTSGLRHNPNSKSLQQRYLELGGKPPLPEPHAQTPAASLPIAPADAAPTTPAGPSQHPVQDIAGETPPTRTPAGPITQPRSEGEVPPASPYCRFCP